jgi:sugar lactone lactonase YvrE
MAPRLIAKAVIGARSMAGASSLRRFNSDGSVDHDVDLPVSQPTMCAFAGEGLATIYVTSASYKLSEVEKAKQPLTSVPGRTGIARQLFAL